MSSQGFCTVWCLIPFDNVACVSRISPDGELLKIVVDLKECASDENSSGYNLDGSDAEDFWREYSEWLNAK